MTLSAVPARTASARPHRHFARLTAVGVTVGVAAAAIVGSTGASAAAEPISQSEGRFLTGTVVGQSFDSVAAISGEAAQYPNDVGPNENGLSASVLGQALSTPLSNISVPLPGGVTFGAVGQYANAKKDGSATASSGLIGSNGGINVAGSGNSNVATIDLANLPGASSLTNTLGDLTLKVGAVSSQAKQAAFGEKLADPSASCTGGTYKRVSDSDQAGSYQFSNLTLSATSPLLTSLGTTLTNAYSTLSTAFNTAANNTLTGVVTVSGVPTATNFKQALTVSLAGGGVTASLADGSLTIDLAKILKSVHLDINNLCPNTSLTSYLSSALAGLPSAIDDLVTNLGSKVTAALGKATITVAGVPISAQTLTGLISTTTDQFPSLATYSNSVTTPLNTALQPAVEAISNNLLALTANSQNETSGTFTVAALVLKLVPNGGSLPTVPGLPTLPALTGLVAAIQHNGAAPATSVTLVSARLAAPLAAAPTGTPVLQLNLAASAVTNNVPAAAAPTSSTSSAPASSGVSATDLPTGVPAGAAGHQGGGSPVLPIVLVLIGLVLAGGGVTAYRGRGKFSH